MNRRVRITRRPSKASGIMSAVVGGIFVLIGIFVAIPIFGLFGILWTAIAAVITISGVYGAFGKGKNGNYNEYMGTTIDIEGDVHSPAAPTGDAADRLRRLEELYRDGLLTMDEYEEKRSEIIKEL